MNKNLSKKSALLIGLTVFTYNLILFLIAGLDGHGGAFWASYIFINISFASLIVCVQILKNQGLGIKDYMFQYPILKNCAIYIGVEMVASIIFMVLDYQKFSWKIAVAVQVVLFVIYLIFVISGLKTKEIMDDVATNVKQKTSAIKLMKVDVELLEGKATDPAAKAALKALAEQLRYSDPVSNDQLLSLENEIADVIAVAKQCVSGNDNDGVLKCCEKASELLVERNTKCKILK